MTQKSSAQLIQDILAARRQASAVILSNPAQSIPSAPAPSAAAAQSVPDAPTPEPAPLTESQLAAVLARMLPQILAGVGQARAAYGDRKISWQEGLTLGTTVIGIVSSAVQSGAPLVQGQSARTLVIVIFGVLFDQFLAPLLPAWARPFAGLIKASVIRGLEALYQTMVKLRPTVPGAA